MGILVQAAKTSGLVAFYYIFSVSLTFYNKWILTGYPFPLSITMVHLIVKFIIAWIVRKLTSLVTGRTPLVLGWREYLKNITPIAIFSALDIGLSNWSLVFITISLYTMSKSTALIFILLFAVLLRLEPPRLSQMGVVILIVCGLFMFTFQSTTFDLEGFILVISASVITGIRWTTAQLALQKEELGLSNPVDTVFHLQPIMILTLLPLALIVDGVHVGTSELIFRATSFHQLFWTSVFILFAAVVAFGLGTSEYLLVYHTSGLTLSVSGVLKEVIILTISTVYWEEDHLSAINIVGMIVCVGGIALHVVFKIIRAKEEERLKSAGSSSSRDEVSVKLLPLAGRSSNHKFSLQEEGESDSEDSIDVYDSRRL